MLQGIRKKTKKKTIHKQNTKPRWRSTAPPTFDHWLIPSRWSPHRGPQGGAGRAVGGAALGVGGRGGGGELAGITGDRVGGGRPDSTQEGGGGGGGGGRLTSVSH